MDKMILCNLLNELISSYSDLLCNIRRRLADPFHSSFTFVLKMLLNRTSVHLEDRHILGFTAGAEAL